ncbi:MAG: DUF222 domain-containing protein [Acidimicrobiales bacterium]
MVSGRAVDQLEAGGVVDRALRLVESPDVDGEPTRPPAARRADSLTDICRHSLDHQQTRRGGRHRPHVNVVVNVEDIDSGRGGQILDGPTLDHPSIERLVCDSALHRVVMAGRSSILDYGTATRTIPAPLWNALVIRDRHCRFPGCDRPAEWCDGHHVIWFSRGGDTALSNLALVCSRHHHRLHTPGWHAKLTPDATLEVTDPHGQVRTSHPPGTLPLRT